MGGDDRGLMYGLLDVADRIGWASDLTNPFSEIDDVSEAPAVAERSLSIYTMQKEQFERRLHNPGYWARYLDLLAQHRFNTFTLIFGYETKGYMAPPYPYFFNVPGFPGVHAVGYSQEDQRANLDALNRLISMTHERGLDFSLAIWDHIYRGGVQGGQGSQDPSVPMPYRVMGVTEENLFDYSVAALARLFQLVPNLDAIQFRMHGESGLKPEEMDRFWDQMYDVIRTYGNGIRFDARAKGFPDRLIDRALSKGINIRICTKYWMEQMGLPYHPTHIHPQNQKDRRHGYADLLRYPRRYSMLWRLWNGGTTRILLWGDPEYVRRFAASTHLYDGDGYDVNEPLATKMASHDHDRAPFELLEPAYRYYDYEFERYWHFFQLFGRIGYNPNTSPRVWEQEFAKRFGPDAGPYVQHALHLASGILPRTVAYNYPYDLFPTTRGWAEKQPFKRLPAYAAALPSDTEQFLSMDEAARYQLEGVDTGRLTPQTSSGWFANVSEQVLALTREAEARIGSHESTEFASTIVDLRILAYIARYHGHRALAGFHYALYKRANDLWALDDAIAQERDAIAAWEALIDVAKDVYTRNFMMGREHVGLAGRWEDELLMLQNGLLDLEAERALFQPPAAQEDTWIAHVPVRKAQPRQPIRIRATVSAFDDTKCVQLRYRDAQDRESVVEMLRTDAYLYEGEIPAAAAGDVWYLIEPAGGDSPWDEAIHMAVTIDETPPVIEHTPPQTVGAGEPLTIRAQVNDASGIKWVQLSYRAVNQYLDFERIAMLPTGEPNGYAATISAEQIDPMYDLMYYLEAVDQAGNGCIYPDLEEETPYIVVSVDRSVPEAYLSGDAQRQ
jgi:hypothetical protein